MFNERLQIQTSNLLSVKRDISTARNQLQSLSREQCDSISSVTAKIKLTLTKNQSILLERISQLSTQYDLLWQVKQNMDSENKRLVDSIKESESQLNQKTEEDKIVMSQLRREIYGKAVLFCVVSTVHIYTTLRHIVYVHVLLIRHYITTCTSTKTIFCSSNLFCVNFSLASHTIMYGTPENYK